MHWQLNCEAVAMNTIARQGATFAKTRLITILYPRSKMKSSAQSNVPTLQLQVQLYLHLRSDVEALVSPS